jgi:hypothetical protein
VPVIGPDGLPEAFTWVVGDPDGPTFTEIDPAGGRDRSFALAPAHVRWLLLMPQRPGLQHHALRIPEGATAWFTRRRVKEGQLGVPGSDRHVGSWTGIGWRLADGNGPTLFFRDDGSSVSGEDDGTLTRPMEVTLA